MCVDIKISVVVPVHNTPADVLNSAIESIESQTFDRYELICVDDGSTNDYTKEALSKIERKLNTVVIRKEKPEGAASARNTGLALAKGKYVIFLDSDDIFDEHLLENLYREAEEKDLDISGCSFETMDENGMCQKVSHLAKFQDAKDNELRLLSTAPAPWNKLYKREYIEKIGAHFQNISSCNDLAFYCYTMLCTDKISIDYGRPLIKYRVNTSFQTSSRRNACNLWKAIEYSRELLIKKGLYCEKYKKMLDAVLVANGVSELRVSHQNGFAKDFYCLCQNYFRNNDVTFEKKDLEAFRKAFCKERFENNWFLLLGDHKAQLHLYGRELMSLLKNNAGAIYVWGVGNRGRAFLNWATEIGIKIEGVCDKNNTCIEDYICGTKVVCVEDVIKSDGLIIASNSAIYDSLKKESKKLVNLEIYCPY